MTRDCVFCRIVAGDVPAHVVHEDDRTIALMDMAPATEGHTLVLPKAHADDLWTLDERDGTSVWRAIVRVAGAVRRALAPDGLNVVHASGRAAWQSVFHFHVHIVPRYEGDGLVPPWSLKQPPGDPEVIARAAERIRREL